MNPSHHHPFSAGIPIAPVAVALLAAALAVPVPAHGGDSQGFLYGRVTTRGDDVYEGRLRWNGKEEAFWGDLMNGTKDERPFLDAVPEEYRPDRRSGRGPGIRIGGGASSRSFQARFGDVESIEIRRRTKATVFMKGGEKLVLEGGSNDLGARIVVWDAEKGRVELEWARIETIRFLPTPASLEIEVSRLHGKVETDAGSFEGFVQWDQEECLSSDKLDGNAEGGERSIEMGTIGSIERLSNASSLVTLRGGEAFEMSGTNDVNAANRGIFVEDSRFGRVLVPWDAFRRVDFAAPGPSGPAYGAFGPGRELRGRVTETSGTVHQGRIVYDVDEASSWEILSGEQDGVTYHVPFVLIRTIEPQGDRSRVTLRGGEELELRGSADVGEGNDGIVVVVDGGSVYVAWDDVGKIEFADQ